MSESISNLIRGVNESSLVGRDVTKFVNEENFVSLNNFIRYGSYDNGRSHVLSKNKSIADILLLSNNQITILLNFIEMLRLNKELLIPDEKDDTLLNKVLVSIQNAPNNLPMYFDANNLNEEIFYYRLIVELYNYIKAYEVYCKKNGFNKLYTVGITSVAKFNGYLNEIAEIMANFIIKLRVVYTPEELGDKVPDDNNENNNDDEPSITPETPSTDDPVITDPSERTNNDDHTEGNNDGNNTQPNNQDNNPNTESSSTDDPIITDPTDDNKENNDSNEGNSDSDNTETSNQESNPNTETPSTNDPVITDPSEI